MGLVEWGTAQLWYGSSRVPIGVQVYYWPGIRPCGELTEYQLIIAAAGNCSRQTTQSMSSHKKLRANEWRFRFSV
eukprot:3126674-Amphidinium_carterae.1